MNAAIISPTIIEADASAIGVVMPIMEKAFDGRFGEAWKREQCLNILGLPGVSLTMAQWGQTAAGFALCRTIADEAELLLIAVTPEMQGKGVGTQLLKDMINRVVCRGVRRLHLEVRDGNPAFELYQRLGFNTVGRRQAYYRGCSGESFDALTLTLIFKVITGSKD